MKTIASLIPYKGMLKYCQIAAETWRSSFHCRRDPDVVSSFLKANVNEDIMQEGFLSKVEVYA